MIVERDATYLTDLVHNLRRLPSETEWVEFKVNQATDPQKIGEYLSALSNGAALNGKDAAYLLWGIQSDSHAVVGTGFMRRKATSFWNVAGPFQSQETTAAVGLQTIVGLGHLGHPQVTGGCAAR